MKFADHKKASKMRSGSPGDNMDVYHQLGNAGPNSKPEYWYGSQEGGSYAEPTPNVPGDLPYGYSFPRNRAGGSYGASDVPPPPSLQIHSLQGIQTPPMMPQKHMYPHYPQGLGVFPDMERLNPKDMHGPPPSGNIPSLPSNAMMGHPSQNGTVPSLLSNPRQTASSDSSAHARPPEGDVFLFCVVVAERS